MGFRINTNVAAMNAHRNASQTNLGLDKSLNSLSSGLRINKAADDASGMSIADSLRSQANGLGQAIRNANDGIAVVQTADGALDEYINIIDRVRTLSIQSASDGQNSTSRQAIQNDITKLLEEAQNIATTTSFNGLNLLDGTFTDKNFQIGAYANETVGVTIGNVQTDSVGAFAEKEGAAVTAAALVDGDLTLNGVSIDATVAGTGTGRTDESAWSKANAINAKTSSTGVTADATTVQTATAAVTAGTIAAGDLVINGIDIGLVAVTDNDADSSLVNAINAKAGTSHVTASLDASSNLILTASDGEDIVLTGANSTDAITHTGDNGTGVTEKGTITLSSTTSSIAVGSGTNDGSAIIGFTAGGETVAETGNLGAVDVTTYTGAQTAIKTSDAALRQVDAIRSDIGSTQNQLESTIRNISVTQVNVTAAESQIRDVDFAAESANFAKLNILAQSGSYAMSQANAVQQNVLRLLQ